MDQNLRGARALTAENLQRATSMQAHHAPYRNRYLGSNGSLNSPTDQESGASKTKVSPLGHARGRSDAVLFDVPRRPSTAMARETLPSSSDARERPVADSAAWTANTLRGTRSQELPRLSSRTMHVMSPEPQLEPLIEAGPSPTPIRLKKRQSSSALATTELQEQMQQLKGRISFLREKARADSVRRQSSQAFRAPNPFTDAERKNENAPGRNSGSTGIAGEDSTPPLRPLVSRWSADSSVKRMSYLPRGQWSPDIESPGIMEEEDAGSPQLTEASVKSASPDIDWRPVGHIRQVSHAESVPVQPNFDVASIEGSIVQPSPDLTRNDSVSTLQNEHHDASTTVAHEDREDAFDYHNFFLHSTMGRFNQNSDTASEASDDTARGPRLDPESFPMLGTPKTPEMLRNIERKLHERQMSNNSVATDSDSINSFATATEGRQSPVKKSEGSDGADSGVAFHKDRGFHKRQVSSKIVAQIRTIPADPTSVAVHAVTDAAQQSPMGMKDKTLVFMLVESIKDACFKLQDENTPSGEGRVLRRRLEEARRVLDGHSPVVS